MADFNVYKDKDGDWRWNLKANGKIIADSSEGYKNLSDCEHGIELVKQQAPSANVTGDENYHRAKGAVPLLPRKQ